MQGAPKDLPLVLPPSLSLSRWFGFSSTNSRTHKCSWNNCIVVSRAPSHLYLSFSRLFSLALSFSALLFYFLHFSVDSSAIPLEYLLRGCRVWYRVLAWAFFPSFFISIRNFLIARFSLGTFVCWLPGLPRFLSALKVSELVRKRVKKSTRQRERESRAGPSNLRE